MPRQARTLSESGYMHLIVRGIGKQIMFEEAADYRKFLALLERFCKETEVKPCAYCLMDNHVHLLVCDPNGNTPLLMKKLGVSYALYFNRKYDRSGHLLQDRYLSETVDSDAYLLMVFRYILNNPGKAGICDARNYPWNSYAQYDLPEPWMELSLVRSLLGGLSEYEAFKAYCETYPTNATLLVDTYNTLKSGVPNAIRVFNEVLRPRGITKCGIRLDSGDIAYLSRKAREMLDAAGWESCQISASNSLDEYLIQDLLLQDAKIDMFGVGERMITARSEPVFGGVYKLVAVEDDQGNVVPKIKVSENVEKITVPHFKKVYRFYGNDTGKAIADYMTVYDEEVDDSKDLEIFDPNATWKKKTVYDFHARQLLEPIFLGGKLVYQSPTLPEIKAYCQQQVDTLWDEVKRFDNPHSYYVDLSQKLWNIRHDLLHKSQH